MNNIQLSFCIPTYNRAQTVHRLVTEILRCEDQDLEVVVLDNGSTDDTLNILQTIKDKRLQVHSNGENKGALFNMVNVLDKGRGNFLVYSTDQDYVDNTKITEFKSFLMQHPDLAGGYCTFNSKPTATYEIFPKGSRAIRKIAYQGRHPTGYFFNNKLLKSIQFIERFSDYNFVDLFPLEFAFAELCLMGNGSIYHRPIFTPETGTMVVKHKSATTNGKSKNAFFSPEARLKLAINYSRHIDILQLAPREKYLLTVDIFFHELVVATIGYRSILGNKDLCIHYGMECKNVTSKEMFLIGLNFYRQFVQAMRGILGGSFLQRARFKAEVIYRLLQKIISRGGRLFFREC